MGMAIWILFCLFASVGLVQCGFWLAGIFKSPEKPIQGYFVFPLYDDAERLESDIRYKLSRIRGAGSGGDTVLLVDMGLGRESREICDRLLQDIYGIYICEKNNLAETLENLDKLKNDEDLQISFNDVK